MDSPLVVKTLQGTLQHLPPMHERHPKVLREIANMSYSNSM
jgi:hypothetical protein